MYTHSGVVFTVSLKQPENSVKILNVYAEPRERTVVIQYSVWLTVNEMHCVYALSHTFFLCCLLCICTSHILEEAFTCWWSSKCDSIVKQRSSRIPQMKCMQKLRKCTFSLSHRPIRFMMAAMPLCSSKYVASHESCVSSLQTGWSVFGSMHVRPNTFATVF